MASFGRFVVFLIFVTGIAGCADQNQHYGYELKPTSFSEVVLLKTIQQDIYRRYGSPSAISRIDPMGEHWYYISAEAKKRPILKPKIVESDVVGLSFNEQGVLMKLKRYTMEDMKTVSIAEEVTPSEGHGISIFNQLLGNIGRFDDAGF